MTNQNERIMAKCASRKGFLPVSAMEELSEILHSINIQNEWSVPGVGCTEYFDPKRLGGGVEDAGDTSTSPPGHFSERFVHRCVSGMR